MNKEDILRKHREYLYPCVATYYQEPLVIARGKGQLIYDIDGREYLDFFGGIVTISAGHCNGEITEKIDRQTHTLQHASTLFPTEALVAMAERLAQITPGRLTKSFFTNSGTEADETAILSARLYTGSQEVIALRHGYSGRSALAMSLTGQASWRLGATAIPGIKHALSPYCYRCPLGKSYPDCEVACAKDIEELIQTSTSGRIAAFLAEPIQGIGGFITPPKEYFKIAVDIIRKYGGLFIADEVQTAWGRTGDTWFGIEHWEVVPDIITSAKGMANGVPVGMTVTTPEIADAFKGLSISTFGGNPVSMVAAKATIDFIAERNLLQNAKVVGDYFRARLDTLKDKHPLIGDVRGMGLMQALELVKDRNTKEPATAEMARMMEKTKARGLLIGKGGLRGNVIRMSPPLTISKADVDQAITILDQSFAEQ
ncbi:MAG: aspartate aminotransferase family protein [Acidobacteria bacterium]|nr:aspartate aminotransferase family protein [Acidobacteriota bacterium]MBI3657768.1 aspartate aminotransferase family protein [Acidobacteriota bacterium]